jgi:hypothetical protein
MSGIDGVRMEDYLDPNAVVDDGVTAPPTIALREVVSSPQSSVVEGAIAKIRRRANGRPWGYVLKTSAGGVVTIYEVE